MGRSSTFVCHTCQKEYYLGYGSYSMWCDLTYSLEDYEKRVSECNEKMVKENNRYSDTNEIVDVSFFPKNINVQHCLQEHIGHEIEYDSEDFDWDRDEDLKRDKYEFIDLEEEVVE